MEYGKCFLFNSYEPSCSGVDHSHEPSCRGVDHTCRGVDYGHEPSCSGDISSIMRPHPQASSKG